MKKITEKQARELLKKYAPDNETFQEVFQHVKAVQKAAMVIAKAIQKQGHKVNLETIKIGSLLHDIGRFQCPPGTKKSLQHGIVGAKIMRKEGLSKFIGICKHHIGAGISKQEIIKRKLPLPKKDFFPKTIEEKIIAYADKMIFQDRLAKVSEVVQGFKKLGASPLKRMIKLHNEIEKLRNGKQFI